MSIISEEKKIEVKELDNLTALIGSIGVVIEKMGRKGLEPLSFQTEILNNNITEFIKSSNNSSKWMMRLTFALVGVGAVQAIATVAQVFIIK